MLLKWNILIKNLLLQQEFLKVSYKEMIKYLIVHNKLFKKFKESTEFKVKI